MIWVQHAGDDMPAGSAGWEYVDELQRADDEPLVHKHFGDAFEDTDLEARSPTAGSAAWSSPARRPMRASDRTLHGALARGYDATLVADAHTTEDMREWGLPIGPEDAIAYTNLYWSFSSAPGRRGTVVPTSDVDFAAT